MPKLKVLSADEVVALFARFGFQVTAQRGSHLKLKRISEGGLNQTLTIPNHKELDRGTLKAIYNQALRYIPEERLHAEFYTD